MKKTSSTSRAVAEERHDVSSKSTMDEMADAITGGNDIGLWASGQPIYLKKIREY